ncbi:MAG: hypothetical protein K9K30_01690 [Burkholderiaceae bacterium]|nr:hypothetical protein [Sulfuritalea sp.]MCF8173928.1 hypothetical protein [Burkholderiaceae bacterium]
MIEALIASALVLVPLFLAIPVIAKYQDIKAYTVQSARYAAWERTVWFGGASAATFGIGSGATFSNKWDANEKTDDQIRAEIGTRLLSDTGTTAFSSADKSGSSYSGGPKQLWRDRRGTTLLTDYGDIGATYANEKAPGLINNLLTPLVQISSVVSNFMVDTKGRYTATVALSVQQVAYNTDAGLGACASCPVDYLATGTKSAFSAKNVILANGWNANGPGSHAEYSTVAGKKKMSVYNQVRGLTPSSLIKPSDGGFFDTALKVLKGISLVFFPELSTLDLGRIEVDRVPADRLQ